jgi:hypothetical protein
MSFLTPFALLFALALPVVVAFYLLKRRRTTRLTSSTLLWRRFLAETQANAPFQRLRANWLLALQLLLLSLVVLALIRPYFQGTARHAHLRVLVLDGSASMQSTDETPTRFDAAKAEAGRWIDGMRGEEQMMILLAGASAEVRQSPTRDKGALHRALDACRASECSTRLAEALQTAAAFTYDKRGEEQVVSGEIHLFSDGAAPDLAGLANRNLPLIYHKLGRAAHNLGIVSLDVRTSPENPADRAVFAGIANASPSAWPAEVELRFNDRLVELKPVEVPATNTTAVMFLARQEVDGVFTVRITTRDDLALDNEASLFSPLPRPAQVRLVTRGNRFLERALASAPGVLLTTSDHLDTTGADPDVVVLDDVLPAVWPKAALLAIRVAETNWFDDLATEQAPLIVDWNHSHPLLRYVNFDNVDIAESLLPRLPSWAIPLVQSQQRPLIVAGERDHRRVVWMGFDPLRSTWPLRISFPIFVANAVEWLNPSASATGELGLHPGQVLRHTLREPASTVEILTPGGARETVSAESGAREVLYGATGRHGVYRLRAGTNQVTFCVNLLDAAETDTTPRNELPLGKYAGTQASTLQASSRELWRWFAAAALGVLLLEWWYYHHRTA